MAYKVRFSHSARTDINHIVRFISSDNREQAFRFAKLLIEQAMSYKHELVLPRRLANLARRVAAAFGIA
jgi:hypothetical protein